jgi:hypothetical protein
MTDRCRPRCYGRAGEWAAGASRRLGDQGGGQSGEEDARAAFEFGGAVVEARMGARLRSRGIRRSAGGKAQPQHVAGFAGILGEFLALVGTWPCMNPTCCMARWLSRWSACRAATAGPPTVRLVNSSLSQS